MSLLLTTGNNKVNILMELLTFPEEHGINTHPRRSAGAVERDGLENRCGGNSTQGSNPCSSAMTSLYGPSGPFLFPAHALPILHLPLTTSSDGCGVIFSPVNG